MKLSFALSLLLLFAGGCSKEPTELERCIKANTLEDKRYLRYDEFIKNYEGSRWIDIEKGIQSDEWNRKVREAFDPINELEEAMDKCESDTDYYSNIFEDFLESKNISRIEYRKSIELQEEEMIFWRESVEHCKEIITEHEAFALKLCHSQGVY